MEYGMLNNCKQVKTVKKMVLKVKEIENIFTVLNKISVVYSKKSNHEEEFSGHGLRVFHHL
ncbi:MAG: hypothetical protein K9G64_02090 [Bacteroidia bacterium]|nr:hypothetical protein [Bacteroidia bacterium]